MGAGRRGREVGREHSHIPKHFPIATSSRTGPRKHPGDVPLAGEEAEPGLRIGAHLQVGLPHLSLAHPYLSPTDVERRLGGLLAQERMPAGRIEALHATALEDERHADQKVVDGLRLIGAHPAR